MASKLKNDMTDRLFKHILSINTVDEHYQLFEDLCTIHEIQSIAQRMAVAEMLYMGKTYLEIAEATGASTATISRVNRSLNYGTDGYKLAIERVRQEESRQNETQR